MGFLAHLFFLYALGAFQRCAASAVFDQKNFGHFEICGEGIKGLLNYQFDPVDEDALITTAAYLKRLNLGLYTGNTNYLNINLANAISPIETVNSKCFSIRSINSMPRVLCAGGTFERNKWINAIEAAMLCATTGVKSGLPLVPGEEVLADLEQKKPSGLNLFIHDGKLGKPEIYINGKTIQELQQQRQRESLENQQDEEIHSYDHLFDKYESDVTQPNSIAPIDPEAMQEAKAEAGIADVDAAPAEGFFKRQTGG